MKLPLDGNRVIVRIHPDYLTSDKPYPESPIFHLSCGYVNANISADISTMTYGRTLHGGSMSKPQTVEIESLQHAIIHLMKIGCKAREDTVAPINAAKRIIDEGPSAIDSIVAHMKNNDIAKIASLMMEHEISAEELDELVADRMNKDSDVSDIAI